MANLFHYQDNIDILNDSEDYRNRIVRCLDRLQGSPTGGLPVQYIKTGRRRLRICPPEEPGKAKTHPDTAPDAYLKDSPVMHAVLQDNGDIKMVPTGEKGTGQGSTVLIWFDSADWPPTDTPGMCADEVIFHELIHAVRVTHGKVLNTTVSEDISMDNFEEFCAVLATNVYRSERGRIKLTKNHLQDQGPLSDALSDSDAYYQFFKWEIDRWISTQADFCRDLAASQAKFNPMRAASAKPKSAAMPPKRSSAPAFHPLP